MSERMIPIPFARLMTWLTTEQRLDGTVFGVYRPYRAGDRSLPIFGERIETPFGPAAGPATQLAQNLIAGYYAGARFFELKTVQKVDGADLAACVNKPCIRAEDECYNCEWSTELSVQEAFEEYVKAWCAIHMLARYYDLGDPDGIVFNMSVGYDLDGIRGSKVDGFLNGMMDASDTIIFRSCIRQLKELFPSDADFIETIPAQISRSVTVSTLHGCPPDEIERIATYLLTEKHLHTFVKCNPTILGYESAREILDGMGYDYVAFGRKHFDEDLQYADAIPMFRRLKAVADAQGLEFGLKLSNTFPVDVTAGELPSEEMYMSGKSLAPLTIEMARRISAEFDGRLRLSYSGGADFFNIDRLFACGIWPITMATTELKPGGYQRFTQIAEKLDTLPFAPFTRVDCGAVGRLAAELRADRHHIKAIKPQTDRKLPEHVPLLDCFTAPCQDTCPIHQDIPAYLELCRQGRYAEALEVILDRNPLPFLTGTLCAHPCMGRCTRNHYDAAVRIRETKLAAAERGYDEVFAQLAPPDIWRADCRAAIVGGGPTGMAAAFLLARSGVPVTLFEKEEKLGGIVRYVIPGFRISDEAIDKDAALLKQVGVDVRCGAPAPSAQALLEQGYTHVLLAVGAGLPGRLELPGNVEPVIGWMRRVKAGETAVRGHVAVIGGGNTAMDAARLALHAGAVSSTIVYRRTKRYMPADAEELEMALADGVQFLELVSPISQGDGKLLCRKMALGEPDASGRRRPVETDETVEIPCDLVVSAVGERVDGQFLADNGVAVDDRGRPAFENSRVYTAGDTRRGPATIVEGIADATAFCAAVTGEEADLPPIDLVSTDAAERRKGILRDAAPRDGERCLHCDKVCQTCADVCPNRANVVIAYPDGRRQIVHIDQMCNECGNCAVFCPYDSAPYRDKLTLFASRKDMDATPDNPGILFLRGNKVRIRIGELDAVYAMADPRRTQPSRTPGRQVRLFGWTARRVADPDHTLPAGIAYLVETIYSRYRYLLP